MLTWMDQGGLTPGDAASYINLSTVVPLLAKVVAFQGTV